MKYNLIPDYNLRGYAFEYISKVLLRRTHKNNFIFQTNQFDNIEEIITKYRFSYTLTAIIKVIEYMKQKGLQGDLIEFILDEKRVITNIKFYDVKTKYCTAPSKGYYEMCKSNFLYFKELQQKSFECKIISIIILPSWEFTFTVVDFKTAIVRPYSRFEK